MRHSFVRVAACSPKLTLGDVDANVEALLAELKKAKEQQADVLVTPELSICGATLGDLFKQASLLSACENGLKAVLAAQKDEMLIYTVGLPIKVRQCIFNAVAVCQGDQILGIVPKESIYESGALNQSRQFDAGNEKEDYLDFAGQEMVPFGSNIQFYNEGEDEISFAVAIGEDAAVAPSVAEHHILCGADLILNPSAFEETFAGLDKRKLLLTSESLRLGAAFVEANAGRGESTTDAVWGGGSFIVEDGKLLAAAESFSDELIVADVDTEAIKVSRGQAWQNMILDDGLVCLPFVLGAKDDVLVRPISRSPLVPTGDNRAEQLRHIMRIQAEGLRRRFEHTHAEKMVLGLSGGLDSTLAFLVCLQAARLMGKGADALLAVTMPCFGTGKRTRDNAALMCESTGVALKTVEIAKTVESHFEDIGHDKDTADTTFENAQARVRTLVLMDLANQVNGFVVGTGDLSELALGWATYNGDHMSMYGVNGTLCKSLVRAVVAQYAEDVENENPALAACLRDVLATPVSPELLPNQEGSDEMSQKTEDLIGPYELHDFFIYYVLKYGFSPAKILVLAENAFGNTYSRETILKWLRNFYRRFLMQQFKRSCLPDGPKVGNIGLSPRGGFSMPSDAASKVWLDAVDKL